MGIVTFPANRTRAVCYACFDFEPGGKHDCPECGRGVGPRLPEHLWPVRPSMFAPPDRAGEP